MSDFSGYSVNDFTTLGQMRDNETGKFRNGRRTPETIYASFSDDLDDRNRNYPVTLVNDVELSRFFVDAANEKLERMRRPADPEAWLADQLAQLPTSASYGGLIVDMEPGEPGFQAALKIAQEYGEMCAARATETIFKSGKVFLVEGDPVQVHVDGSPAADGDRWEGEVTVDNDTLIVRPKEDA